MTTRGLQLRTLADFQELAALVQKAGLLPNRMTPEQAVIAMVYGHELGISALQALQGICVPNGRPAAYGDLFMALCQPVIEELSESLTGAPGTDAWTAVCRVKRRGQDWHEAKFSVADAKRARLWGKQGPWTEYPGRMLQMRARGFALRDRCADMLKGLISREEAEDYPAPPPETPAYRVKDSKPLSTPKMETHQAREEPIHGPEIPEVEQPPASALESFLSAPPEPAPATEPPSELYLEFEAAFRAALLPAELNQRSASLKDRVSELKPGERDKLALIYRQERQRVEAGSPF